jgi:hypothetical protein
MATDLQQQNQPWREIELIQLFASKKTESRTESSQKTTVTGRELFEKRRECIL